MNGHPMKIFAMWLKTILMVAALGSFAAASAFAQTGTVVAWGYNASGQTTIPAGLSGVTAIAAGTYHTVALKNDGTVVEWGGKVNGSTTIPAGLSGVTAIAAGYSYTVALKANGTVVAWGWNGEGQTTIPAGLSGVTAIAAGWQHTVALKNDGTVVAWGLNYNGQTTIPAGLSGVTGIAAGGSHTVALKNNGTVVAWGWIGDGVTTIPAGLSGVTAIAAGYTHTVALKSDGTVVAWGRNIEGQTTVPAGLSGVTAIAAGNSDHTVALKNDGTVVAWGYNDYGQTTVLTGLSGVTAIAAGIYHTVALVAVTASDTTPPSVPTGLTASAISATQINLSWTASTDNVGVTGYKVYRGGTLLATLGNVTSYSNTGLTALTGYSYTVAACDAAANCSAQSTSASVTTPAAADIQAPSVPTGLTVSAASATQINLSWTASTDNVGVTGYKVYRGGVQVGTSAGTNFSDTGLTSATAYSYRVAACDAAGNCSAQSAAASATTSGGIVTLVVGWNLIGNGTNVPLDVAATLGDASKVTTVWKWIPATSKWAFYTPSLVGQALADYAATKGYDVLTSINGGEGFWVNAKQAFTVTPPSGNALLAASFQTTLTPGWNLIAIGEVKTPSQFNLALSPTPPSPGAIPLNLTTLWAWDAAMTNWYFYAPSLDAKGGTALTDYIANKRYLAFDSKVLDPTMGFWVNIEQTTTPVVPVTYMPGTTCPVDSNLQCSQWIANGAACTYQSCTCYFNTPGVGADNSGFWTTKNAAGQVTGTLDCKLDVGLSSQQISVGSCSLLFSSKVKSFIDSCNPTCANGATDYPVCTPPTCANRATNYPACTPPTCAYSYSGWSTCQSNSTQTRAVSSSSPAGCVGTPVLSQSCRYTAPTNFALTVTKAGTGSGTVASSPAGIACGATCSTTHTNGTSVTLTATPATGSTFTGWSGACSGTGSCVVTMDANKAVTATFNTAPTNNTGVTGITFDGGVGGFGSFINVKITPLLYGISITCNWSGSSGSNATRTTTTLGGNATCANSDVASWPDNIITITATVTGTNLTATRIYQ